jgi:hypothetical protein
LPKKFNSIPKSIKVETKVCLHSSTNSKSIKSYGMEPLDFLELPTKNKPNRFYEKTYVFQDTWACHFPWAKPVIGDDGFSSSMHCLQRIIKKTKVVGS